MSVEPGETRAEVWGLVDKSGWSDGPWAHEPDRVDWRAHDFPCLALRHDRYGHWCGYVGVPPGHPWHGVNAALLDADFHGGVTFTSPCMKPADAPGVDPRSLVCHVPRPGESADVWWVGGDFFHFMDRGPGMEARMRETDALLAERGYTVPPLVRFWERDEEGDDVLRPTYKPIGYVVECVEYLAEQAYTATPEHDGLAP